MNLSWKENTAKVIVLTIGRSKRSKKINQKMERERTGFNTHEEPHPSELLDASVSIFQGPHLPQY